MSGSDSKYPEYFLWESDPQKDPDHKARLDCLFDLRSAMDGLTTTAASIAGGIFWILILLFINAYAHALEGYEFLWAFPIVLFIIGVPGICYYGHKYLVSKTRLMGMTVKCWNPRKCGRQVRADYKFCPFCGCRLPSLPPRPSYFPQFDYSL